MAVYSLLAISFIMKLVAVVWFLTALILIFVVLIQKGKGGGLGAVFGGGMAGSLLGADTKKPMTWFTIGLVFIFLFLAVLMAKFYKPTVSETGQEVEEQRRVDVPGIRGDIDDAGSSGLVEVEVDDANSSL